MSRYGGPQPISTCPNCGAIIVYMPRYDQYGTLIEEVECISCGAKYGGAAMWKE